jgi:tetratricopeptide (TPR) repeat protein
MDESFNSSESLTSPGGDTDAVSQAAIAKGLVFIELKDEVRQRLELPGMVPIFKTDLDEELKTGQIAPAAFAAGIEALKLLSPEIAEYDRFLARYYLLEGQRNLEAQDSYQAQRFFEKALDLNQTDLSAEAAFYLGALVGEADSEQAINFYRLSIDLNPVAATPHFELARLLRERRDLPGALAEFEEAYRLEPTSANLLNEVAETHLMVDDLPKARAAFLQATILEPDIWFLPVRLGITEYNMEEYAAAIRSLRKGLDLAPEALEDDFTQGTYIEGLYYLGLAYRDAGRPDQARKLFRSVLQLNPQHEGSREALAV